MNGDYAAVDSELTLLYSDLKQGKAHPIAGPLLNPFFGKREAKFAHPEFPMYLVTRLAAYDLEGVKAIIDRSMHAANQGKFVIDMESPEPKEGDSWLRQAANLLPKDRVIFDDSEKVIYDQTGVIGYAGWGSNDHNRHRRFLGFHWLPGAIATEFVSTNGRTFQRPPDNWNISDWQEGALVCRQPANPHRGLFARRRHRRHRSRVRTVSRHDSASRVSVARLLFRPQSGGELLSFDPRAELAEHRDRRSAVLARSAGTLNLVLLQTRFKPLFRNPHLATIAGNFWRRPESEQQWPVETVDL